LDHTGARLRVSMHARTLVEMAIVRICQLGELEDLATLVAELRGVPIESPTKSAAPAVASENRPAGSLSASVQAQVAAKKNVEPRPGAQETARPTGPVPPIEAAPTAATPTAAPVVGTATNGTVEAPVRRTDPAHLGDSPP